jgi:hypothetical protein
MFKEQGRMTTAKEQDAEFFGVAIREGLDQEKRRTVFVLFMERYLMRRDINSVAFCCFQFDSKKDAVRCSAEKVGNSLRCPTFKPYPTKGSQISFNLFPEFSLWLCHVIQFISKAFKQVVFLLDFKGYIF